MVPQGTLLLPPDIKSFVVTLLLRTLQMILICSAPWEDLLNPTLSVCRAPLATKCWSCSLGTVDNPNDVELSEKHLPNLSSNNQILFLGLCFNPHALIC